MAIPILWPSSDDVEDNCGSVDLLLEELLVTLRQILVQRRQERALNRVEYRRKFFIFFLYLPIFIVDKKIWKHNHIKKKKT